MKRNFKYFKDWTPWDVEHELGYNMVKKMPELVEWMRVEGEIPTKWTNLIEAIQNDLIIYNTGWNETDLLANFIAPLLVTIDFKGEGFNHYNERNLSAKIGDYVLSGLTDWMVASGGYEPERPFFFIHEYKRTKGTEADPLGQLLCVMVAAQTLNNSPEQPVYGCYILGKIWNFVLLKGREFSSSQGYDATDENEIVQIWLVLDKTKKIVAELALAELAKKKALSVK